MCEIKVQGVSWLMVERITLEWRSRFLNLRPTSRVVVHEVTLHSSDDIYTLAMGYNTYKHGVSVDKARTSFFPRRLRLQRV